MLKSFLGLGFSIISSLGAGFLSFGVELLLLVVTGDSSWVTSFSALIASLTVGSVGADAPGFPPPASLKSSVITSSKVNCGGFWSSIQPLLKKIIHNKDI